MAMNPPNTFAVSYYFDGRLYTESVSMSELLNLSNLYLDKAGVFFQNVTFVSIVREAL